MGQALLDDVFGGEDGVAKLLINALGGSGTLTTPGAGAYNPLTGSSAAGADTVDAVDATPPEAYSEREINGSSIKKGDCYCTIPACDVSTEPVAGKSLLTLGSAVWHVVDFDPLSSGSKVVSYKLHLRK